jgi:hypothetical protein
MRLSIIALTLLCSCAVKLTSDPINVKHTIGFDLAELTEYFTQYCIDNKNIKTQQELDTCVNNEIVNFFKLIENVTPEQ